MIRDLEQDILLIEEQIQEIKRLRLQIGNLEVQIADYQQIVRELSECFSLHPIAIIEYLALFEFVITES